MVALFLSTFLSFFLFISFGDFISKLLKTPFVSTEILLLGLVVSNTSATCFSIFFPINSFVLITLILLGVLFLIIAKKDFKKYAQSLHLNKYILFSSFAFIILAFISSLNFPDNYDSSLYHIQSIKWIEEYPVVPGLANLHGRFGFNPNIFTFYALTSLKDIFGQEIFSLNFAVFSILVFYYIKKTHSSYIHGGFSNLFLFFLFQFLILLGLPNLSSPSPDYLSTAISLFVFSRMLDLSSQKKILAFTSYIPILLLSVYLVTIKLAAIPILLLFIFVLVKFKSEALKSLRILPFIALIIFPWIVRNVITSGWLIYPFPLIDLFNFDWKVPLESVIYEKNIVSGFARIHHIDGANMALFDWLPLWWHRIDFIYKVLFITSIVFPSVELITQLFKKNKNPLFTNAIIITSFLGVLFWFILAPEWRFGQSFIIIASMTPLLSSKSYLRIKLNEKFIFSVILILSLGYYTMGKTGIVLCAVLSLLCLRLTSGAIKKTRMVFGLLFFVLFINYSKVTIKSLPPLSYSNLLIPLKLKIPADVRFKTYKINNIDVYVPTNGDKCYDHAIPCTPYPNKNVVLRKQSLKYGFKQNKKIRPTKAKRTFY